MLSPGVHTGTVQNRLYNYIPVSTSCSLLQTPYNWLSMDMFFRDPADVASKAFGVLCITSAFPFVGIPIPTRSWATYYAGKNEWLSQLSGRRLNPTQAGYAGALLRIVVGACFLSPTTREAALLFNGAVVCCGTVLAYRDGRPMRPQWTMLGAITLCLVLGRL